MVKDIVGEKIREYGFKYLKTEQQNYYFLREIGGVRRIYDPSDNRVRQYILIQKNRFDQLLTVRFFTDVYGNEMVHDVPLPNSENGWIRYRDNESYVRALEILVHVIECYGLEFLQNLSKEEIIPTKEMSNNLFKKHQELEQKLIEKYSIKLMPESEGDIDDWFNLIKKIINDCIDEPYENVKNMLVEISAFLGNRACFLLSSQWAFPQHLKTPITSPSYNSKYHGFKPLITVVALWKDKYNEEKWSSLDEYRSSFKAHFLEKK